MSLLLTPPKNGGIINSSLAISFIFFSLACADLISVKIGGASVRLFYASIFIIPFLHQKGTVYPKKLLLFLGFFLFTLLPSVVFSATPLRSFLYFSWVVVTFLSTYSLVNFCYRQLILSSDSTTTIRARYCWFILITYRFQIIAALAFYATGLQERPMFLYYEPSYFAISLSIYVSVVLYNFYNGKNYGLDALLILLFLVTSFSATFAMVLSILLLFYILEHHSYKSIFLLLVSSLAFLLYIINIEDTTTAAIKSFIYHDASLLDVLLRGGNRLPRLILAYDTFTQNFLAGIGLGGFENYSHYGSVPDFLADNPWMEVQDMPAINIFLEIGATAGIAGLIGFLVLLWPVVSWGITKGFSSPAFKALLCMLLILTFESNYLRPYLWICIFFCWFEMSVSTIKR